MMKLTYRSYQAEMAPRRPKVEVPGWAGQSTHELPQPWHCKPFLSAATYGLEVYFNWRQECQVTMRRGQLVWSGDLSAERPEGAPEDWSPFSAFSPNFFGLSSMLDIKVPKDFGLMILPHPRYFTDTTGTAPCAVSGLIETNWWPRMFFLVFKAPPLKGKIIFKHNDPIAQLIVVPLNEEYKVTEMSDKEKKRRNNLAFKLATKWQEYSSRIVFSKDGYPFFHNKYKRLSRVACKHGPDEATACIDDPSRLPNFGEDIRVADYRSLPKKPNRNKST